jgi:hypothetical protein
VPICAVEQPAFGASPMPIGFQFIGGWWSEAMLLRLSGALEAVQMDEQNARGCMARPANYFLSQLDNMLDIIA